MPSRREKFERLRGQLKTERQSFIPHYQDLADYINPRGAQFTTYDTNRGEKRNQLIVDSTASFAARTLSSGMMSGITSPARPWFRLTTPNPDMAEFGPVKEWLHYVSERMTTIYLRSNVYNILPTLYKSLGVFGTPAMGVFEDLDTTIHCHSFPVGSFMIGTSDKGRVVVFCREFTRTVRQIVETFGRTREKSGSPDWSNISKHVKSCYDNGEYETKIDVVHLIAPNELFDETSPLAAHKRFASCYYEQGTLPGAPMTTSASFDTNTILSESGFDLFPILAPRWEVNGEDIYATDCPGMMALGDIKALQTMQRRKAQGLEKMINPPLKGPASLVNKNVSLLPGAVSYLDVSQGGQSLEPIHQVNLQIDHLRLDILDHQQRIKKAFFEDLFLMLAETDRREITAREIDERREEKFLVIGPVLEQLNQDLLGPLIDITFQMMQRQGLIPEPPEELAGQNLKVEYISVMAQAQKLIGLGGLERFTSYITSVAAIEPRVLDKYDSDQAADVYGDLCSVAPGVVRSDDKVEALRAAREKAAQAAQAATVMKDASGAAKNLSQSDMSGDNALTRLLDQANAGKIVPDAA